MGNQFARAQFTFSRNATQNLAQTGVTGDPFADFLLGETFQAESAVAIATAQVPRDQLLALLRRHLEDQPRVTLNFGCATS